jgi:hypothetical protein
MRNVLFLRRFGGNDFNLTDWNSAHPFANPV